MSVTEIQAQIDKLSAEIVRQKNLLTNLERSKSAAQRRLNAVRDPVARLPLEISSEIFIKCLPTRPNPGGRHAPMLLANVCNAWSDIALSTPALWAAIHFHNPPVDLTRVLDAWIERAGSRLLSLSLPHTLSGDVSAIIGPRAHRLQSLKMCHDNAGIRLITAAGPFPILKTLTMSMIDGWDKFTSTGATMDMLRACPNLMECFLDDVQYDEHDSDAAEMLILPHLQHLKFGTHDSPSGDFILQRITLPGLRTLFIPFVAIQPDGLLQFLRRSSPPLRQLGVGDVAGWVEWTLHEMEECLSLLPILTHFELFRQRGLAPHHFLTILATSPHLLPNLSSVTFGLLFSPAELLYQKLVGALLARRTQLHVVRVVWEDTRSELPRENVAAQLRQFAADGMSIYLGTEERNYI
ncbi:hypothetical protein B0H17DRAFT_100730 [Mycena rosella]|uniref:F-box domain-containing protein n=1 Tax=Mycena rosella TaxID=1033263 RepID=A0AAD7GBD5_MYCRO|nr:hypothetical protein B0H17DRAFT_100730 [Mycena rosella]